MSVDLAESTSHQACLESRYGAVVGWLCFEDPRAIEMTAAGWRNPLKVPLDLQAELGRMASFKIERTPFHSLRVLGRRHFDARMPANSLARHILGEDPVGCVVNQGGEVTGALFLPLVNGSVERGLSDLTTIIEFMDLQLGMSCAHLAGGDLLPP